jgi:serine/threonine-protein kinase HipA
MRKGEIYFMDIAAGTLIEDEKGYTFKYYKNYINSGNPPVSLTMPLTDEAYTSLILFPFFDGLIPEGWLLDIAEKTWKLNPRDRMGLLLACCSDCIGAVSVHRIEGADE